MAAPDAEAFEETIALKLRQAEALVLFEFLSRFSESGVLSVSDPAEERALWDLLALLESKLAAPLSTDYSSLLATARDIVRDKK